MDYCKPCNAKLGVGRCKACVEHELNPPELPSRRGARPGCDPASQAKAAKSAARLLQEEESQAQYERYLLGEKKRQQEKAQASLASLREASRVAAAAKASNGGIDSYDNTAGEERFNARLAAAAKSDSIMGNLADDLKADALSCADRGRSARLSLRQRDPPLPVPAAAVDVDAAAEAAVGLPPPLLVQAAASRGVRGGVVRARGPRGGRGGGVGREAAAVEAPSRGGRGGGVVRAHGARGGLAPLVGRGGGVAPPAAEQGFLPIRLFPELPLEVVVARPVAAARPRRRDDRGSDSSADGIETDNSAVDSELSDEEPGPAAPPPVDVGEEGFEVHVCQKVPKRGLGLGFRV
jgi:hypothetical protein